MIGRVGRVSNLVLYLAVDDPDPVALSGELPYRCARGIQRVSVQQGGIRADRVTPFILDREQRLSTAAKVIRHHVERERLGGDIVDARAEDLVFVQRIQVSLGLWRVRERRRRPPTGVRRHLYPPWVRRSVPPDGPSKRKSCS